MAGVVATLGQVNGTLLRPFRQSVSLLDVALVLALLLTVAGMWHLVLDQVEID